MLYSEDEPQETFPASRVISSQILGYDGGEVDSNERVKVLFPVHVSLFFICLQLYNRCKSMADSTLTMPQCCDGIMDAFIALIFTKVIKAH